MEIKLNDLLSIIDILKVRIKDNFQDTIEIDSEDFYWQIPFDELYDPTKCPDELTLGQLSDDWMELLRLKEVDEHPISYDLIRLAAILEIVKKKSSGMW